MVKNDVLNCLVLADFAGLSKENHQRVVNAVRLKYTTCAVLPDYDFAIENIHTKFTYYICFIEKSQTNRHFVNVCYQSRKHAKRIILTYDLSNEGAS